MDQQLDTLLGDQKKDRYSGDAWLDESAIKERLSIAYVSIVAAQAGYTIASIKPDYDGIDIHIRAGGNMRPCIDLQLKSTINLGQPNDNGQFHFPLKIRELHT